MEVLWASTYRSVRLAHQAGGEETNDKRKPDRFRTESAARLTFDRETSDAFQGFCLAATTPTSISSVEFTTGAQFASPL